MLSRDDLHDYQRHAVGFIERHASYALWLGLGMGKTVSTLTAVSDLIDASITRRVLVIAPLRVANNVWPKEVSGWSHLSHLRVRVCTGTQKQRLAALDADADIYVINRENVVWLVKHYGKKWPFDMVIIDEASSFKSSKAQRWRALRRVMPYMRRVVQLTGTMAPNGLIDLWAQIYLLDAGERLGKTKTGFLQRWFESDYMGYRWTPKPGSDSEIHSRLKDICMSMSARDYLDLPPRIDSVVEVDMPTKCASEYSDLERKFLLEINGESKSFDVGAIANKCLQYANGAVYDDNGAWHETHTAKLDELAQIVEDNAGETLLVAYNYKSDLERLRARFPQAETMDAPDVIERWNAGEIPMLLAHPASAGHGLNLQHGGAVIVWFGLNWSLELYEQFNGRIDRQGQTRPVRVIHIVSKGTIDEVVLTALREKTKTQDALIAYVKSQKLQPIEF